MSIPMFPEGECRPTSSPFVFVHKPDYDGAGYRVWFRVGVQYFRIGDFASDELPEAQALAELFVKALTKFKVEEHAALSAVARAYEQWEADLVLSNAAWGNSLPTLTQELFDRLLEIQTLRNAALAKTNRG